MYQRLSAHYLRWLRVPAEPHAPHGDPASLRVFRAGRNFWNLKLFGWGVTQILAFAGIVFWIALFVGIEREVAFRRESQGPARPLTMDSMTKGMESAGRKAAANQGNPVARGIAGWFAGLKHGLTTAALNLPPWAFPILWLVKIVGILLYLAQLPLTYLAARLDFEMRWYMVTDRSLRIRHGVWQVNESTMSFANIQQVVVSQGPLQRLLGLANVKVQSAGGGGKDAHHPGSSGDDMHLGLFQAVTNGSEIRDLILERLRRYRESGLGDPEEKSQPAAPTAPATDDLLTAAHDFMTEARRLRASLT